MPRPRRRPATAGYGGAVTGTQTPAPGVLVETHAFCQHTTTVILDGADGCLVVDPGVDTTEIDALAARLAADGRRVRLGFATHAHWDHLLWRTGLGDAPRYASAATVDAARADEAQNREQAGASEADVDTAWLTGPVPLPQETAPLPWDGPTVLPLVHDAHAPGHTALHLPEQRVLVAGDLLSDVEVPLPDLHAGDPIGDMHAALDLLAPLTTSVDVVVPGHGRVGDRAELRRRLDADRRYLDDLAAGRESTDPRLHEGPDWLRQEHDRARAALAR